MSYLIIVERRQVFSAHGLLLRVAALLQSFVSGQEEAHPGAGGGGRVLARQEETNQHPRNLTVIQGPAVSLGGLENGAVKAFAYLDVLDCSTQ